MNISKVDAIKLINALKSGVPCESMTGKTIVGRDLLIEEVKRQLTLVKTGGNFLKIITGEYGSGKTFFLNHIKNIALESNMIVAHLEINNVFKFYNLEHLYYNIMHNLYIKNSNGKKTSFEDLFERWILKLQSNSKEEAYNEIMQVIEKISKHNATFGRAFLSYVKARINNDTEMKNAIESWITGEKNIPYNLKKKFEVIGNITNLDILDFLQAFIKLITLIGYKGCIILIDEFDVIMDDRKDLRERSYYNIKYIVDSVGNNKLNNMMWIFCGTNRLLNNIEKGFPSVEALYQRMGKPIAENRKDFVDLRQLVIQIDNIRYDDYSQLTEKIVNIYKIAFKISLPITLESLRSWTLFVLTKEGNDIKNITSRSFVKKLLAILDIVQQNPNNHMFRTELGSTIYQEKLLFKTKLRVNSLK